MWPLLLCSILALAVVLERLWFIAQERKTRSAQVVASILNSLEQGDRASAIASGKEHGDMIARTLAHGLSQPEGTFSQALLQQSSRELARFNRGLTVLDTTITLGPLLGLLGTVTGMIGAFSVLGENSLGAPTAITGGIAEALIATTFGLGLAIVALIPYNFLNSQAEQARQDLEDACTQAEMLVLNSKK